MTLDVSFSGREAIISERMFIIALALMETTQNKVDDVFKSQRTNRKILFYFRFTNSTKKSIISTTFFWIL
jgi:hypothetical protein